MEPDEYETQRDRLKDSIKKYKEAVACKLIPPDNGAGKMTMKAVDMLWDKVALPRLLDAERLDSAVDIIDACIDDWQKEVTGGALADNMATAADYLERLRRVLTFYLETPRDVELLASSEVDQTFDLVVRWLLIRAVDCAHNDAVRTELGIDKSKPDSAKD